MHAVRIFYMRDQSLFFMLQFYRFLCRFRYFLVRTTPIELPDTLYMKNWVMFKKWLYIDDDVGTDERQKARDAFVKFIKPKNTLW